MRQAKGQNCKHGSFLILERFNVNAEAHYWTFFNLMMFGTAEPRSASIAEQGFGATFQH